MGVCDVIDVVALFYESILESRLEMMNSSPHHHYLFFPGLIYIASLNWFYYSGLFQEHITGMLRVLVFVCF